MTVLMLHESLPDKHPRSDVNHMCILNVDPRCRVTPEFFFARAATLTTLWILIFGTSARNATTVLKKAYCCSVIGAGDVKVCTLLTTNGRSCQQFGPEKATTSAHPFTLLPGRKDQLQLLCCFACLSIYTHAASPVS